MIITEFFQGSVAMTYAIILLLCPLLLLQRYHEHTLTLISDGLQTGCTLRLTLMLQTKTLPSHIQTKPRSPQLRDHRNHSKHPLLYLGPDHRRSISPSTTLYSIMPSTPTSVRYILGISIDLQFSSMRYSATEQTTTEPSYSGAERIREAEPMPHV